MRQFITMALACLAVLCAPVAGAFSVDVQDLGNGRLGVTLSDIEDADGRVYSLDLATGAITFGDGQTGARPPTGSTGVGSYRFGGGTDGQISAFFPITPNFGPFELKRESDVGIYDFVLVGLRSVSLEVLPDTVTVVGAEFASLAEPTSLVLLLIGLMLVGLRFKGV